MPDVTLPPEIAGTEAGEPVAKIPPVAMVSVFPAATEFQLGDQNDSMIRDALSESSAMVILLTRSTLNSPYVPFEVGAAMGMEKPIFVVYDGIAPSEIPGFLRKYPTIPLSNLPDLVKQVHDVNG